MNDLQNAIEYSRQGLIPGPNETKEAFFKRVDYCLNLKKEIPNSLMPDLPFVNDELNENSEVLKEGCIFSKKIYDISPDWVPLFFSNSDLPFWQGGCAWIFQKSEETPKATFFQLRKHFKTNKTFLGIYDRKELITHELCHVGRMQFDESKFEEILAYNTSNASLRKFLGPLFTSSIESGLFLLFLIVLVIIDFFSLVYDLMALSTLSFFIHMSFVGLIIFGLLRLVKKQYQFKKTLKKLESMTSSAKAVLYRLTDDEIISFSTWDTEAIKKFAEQKKDFRWEVIYKAYFE